ncbi:MAG: C4-dicarboxylate ABC transporter substrate-binding protein [Chlamydiae bacterium]|nr:MAG: C4-dicarboxylate ABC transporter substrate-binding protein [Chlamydiota bacterium]
MRLRLSHITSPGSSWDIGAQKFAKSVNKKLIGKIKVQVFPGGQLANRNQKTELQMLQTGAIDLMLVSPIILALHIDPRFDVFSLPWMFPNHQVANKVCDGVMGDKSAEWLKEKNIKVLAFGVNGFRQLTNNKLPVKSPEDMKRLKIRVAGTKLFLTVFKLLGANPSTMNFGEVFTALAQGTVDGQENPLSIIYSSKLYEVQKYVTLWNYAYDPIILVMSGNKWNSLTEDERKIIKACAKDAMNYQRDYVQNEDNILVKKLTDSGMKVTKPSKKELELFSKRTESVYNKFKNTIGENVIKLCRDEVKKAEKNVGLSD